MHIGQQLSYTNITLWNNHFAIQASSKATPFSSLPICLKITPSNVVASCNVAWMMMKTSNYCSSNVPSPGARLMNYMYVTDGFQKMSRGLFNLQTASTSPEGISMAKISTGALWIPRPYGGLVPRPPHRQIRPCVCHQKTYIPSMHSLVVGNLFWEATGRESDSPPLMRKNCHLKVFSHLSYVKAQV